MTDPNPRQLPIGLQPDNDPEPQPPRRNLWRWAAIAGGLALMALESTYRADPGPLWGAAFVLLVASPWLGD